MLILLMFLLCFYWKRTLGFRKANTLNFLEDFNSFYKKYQSLDYLSLFSLLLHAVAKKIATSRDLISILIVYFLNLNIK